MRLNLSLIFAGLIFFFNPNFNMFDILPDFVGAILIMTGLSKMYVYDANFESARKSARYLLWISVLRLAFTLWAVSSGNRDYLVAFTFIVCVLEAIFMISMFRGLYLGLEYTSMGADCEKHSRAISDAFTMSFIFTLGAKFLEFAPCICDIVKQDNELDLSAGASFRMSMAQMKVYVLGVCLICGLILGIIYVIVTAKTWIKIIADKNYAHFLKEKFDNYVLLDRDAYVAGKIEKVYFLVTFAFVFFFDFYVDGINVLPSLIGILLLAASSIYLSELSGQKNRLVLIFSGAAAASSVINYYFMTRVHLGINHIYSLSSYYKSDFPLLESKLSVVLAGFFSLLELSCTTLLIIFLIMQMKKLFSQERRTVALPMLTFVSVPAIGSLTLAAARNIFTTLEGHLATDDYVKGYVQNKVYITNEENYKAFMSNPLVAQYEKISMISYVLAFVAVAFVLISVLYMIRIRRFTDKID